MSRSQSKILVQNNRRKYTRDTRDERDTDKWNSIVSKSLDPIPPPEFEKSHVKTVPAKETSVKTYTKTKPQEYTITPQQIIHQPTSHNNKVDRETDVQQQLTSKRKPEASENVVDNKIEEPVCTVASDISTASMTPEEQIAMIEYLEEQRKKYPLTHTWVLWYGKWNDPKRVTDFNNIIDFWNLFNNILSPSRIVQKLEYHLFQLNVRPDADDEINKEGGHFVLECNSHDVDKHWLNTVLYLIGYQFTYASNIVGLVVTCRPKFARIQMWVNTSDREILTSIGTEWKALVNYDLRFHKHTEYYGQNIVAPYLTITL